MFMLSLIVNSLVSRDNLNWLDSVWLVNKDRFLEKYEMYRQILNMIPQDLVSFK